MHIKLTRLAVICASLALTPISATASDAGPRIQALATKITMEWAVAHPLEATSLGLTDYDGAVGVASLSQRWRDFAKIKLWKRRLASIPMWKATLVEKNDAMLLRARLTAMERRMVVYRTDRKDYAGPANAIVNALFVQFQYLPVAGGPGVTAADVALAWDHIISRLQKSSEYIVKGQKLVILPGRLFGVVGAQQLEAAPSFLNGALTEAAKAQLDTAKLDQFLAARDATVKTIAATVRYIQAHVDRWPQNFSIGRLAYERMLKDEQLLPFHASDIERMGEDELAHGFAGQAWFADEARSLNASLGPATGGGMAPDGAPLVPYYQARLADLKQWMSNRQIVTIPAWLGEMQVVETPQFLQPVSPGASMQPPRLFSKEISGYYYITPSTSLSDAAKRLDANQDFDRDRIWSTAAHEAMPGHFLQLSIARRHPDYVRRTEQSGVFSEGWAYYGEEMFVQLGMYGSDLDSRYSTAQWERVRGARAIVDVKLATGKWTFERAAEYFAQQTGFTNDAANEAVAGIALSPGEAISYTVGRFQLESLLGEYWRRMGQKASLHDFHDRLLSYGTTPFAVVEPELLADLDKTAEQVRSAANY